MASSIPSKAIGRKAIGLNAAFAIQEKVPLSSKATAPQNEAAQPRRILRRKRADSGENLE
jgi:hypothetical protein